MKTNVFIIAAISGFVATAASAQTPVFADNTASATAVEAIEDSITDAAERPTFANDGRTPGSYGSMSLRGTASTNDGDEDTDIGVGLRYGTFDGVNSIDVTAAFNFSDGENADGSTFDEKNTLLLGADYRRDFNSSLFGYGSVNAEMNKFATGDSPTQEILVSAGLGYRIFNTADTQWSVQAGPGYLMSEYDAKADTDEVAGAISSSFFRSLTDTAFITNDTDVAVTDLKTIVSNELALSVSMTDTLSLRTSYATKYDDSSDDKFSDGSNTLGVSLVYNFN
ncbi:DUF481 domain-containing protein [Yoonia sp. MH D7]